MTGTRRTSTQLRSLLRRRRQHSETMLPRLRRLQIAETQILEETLRRLQAKSEELAAKSQELAVTAPATAEQLATTATAKEELAEKDGELERLRAQRTRTASTAHGGSALREHWSKRTDLYTGQRVLTLRVTCVQLFTPPVHTHTHTLIHPARRESSCENSKHYCAWVILPRLPR